MIKIEKIIPGGQALGTMEDGRKIFFWNALPDEIIEDYEITKKKSHYYEAIATKISKQSNERILEKDECFLSTSPWQIINWDYENRLKAELVVEVFREHGISVNIPAVFTDNNDFYYRNKMEYALYWSHDTSKISLAFHTRGSHRKIPIAQSSIERPELFSAATKIVEDLNSRGEEARKYQSLLLRCNQRGEVSGGLYVNHQPHPEFRNLTDVILNYNYSYSPNGFFQINLPVYELALKEIKKHINTNNVLDLYAGVGTIGLSVARDKSLTLVEVNKSAFTELVKNCEVDFSEGIRSYDEDERAGLVTTGGDDAPRRKTPLAILAKSEETLDYIRPNQTVILDPPRAGCDKKLIDRLNEVKPATIIYLSCNPTTQARDAKMLLENYQIEDIKTFNFFPRTPHIENLIILKKI